MVVGELKLSLGLAEQKVTCNPCLLCWVHLVFVISCKAKFLTDDDGFIVK